VTSVPGPAPTAASGETEAAEARRLGPDSVAVVSVTWRRPQILAALLAALARQSRPIDHVIVVDNSPECSVADLVARFPGTSTYLPSWRQLGSAGGLALGALTALTRGAAWVWFFDDDARPATDECLRVLLACATERRLQMVAPIVVDVDDPTRLSFPLRKGFTWVHEPGALRERAFLPRYAGLFNGALFSATALEVLGVPDSRLFVRGEEVDIYRRALRSGIPFGTCLTTTVLHPSGRADFQPILRGRYQIPDPPDPGKRYYTFRNRGYLSTLPGRRLRWPLDCVMFAWYFLVVRRDAAGFREWLRLARMGRRERLLRRPEP
jgi:rhamnopyranosyl-N-acetylglucosaminyl-diphospho-decaprenol beta-1,3/1,4-galactofuranosyltransferase